MSYLSWNCWGLANLRTVHALQRFISSQDLTVVFLCKTKGNSCYMDRLRLKLNFDRSFTVDNRGNPGGLCVLWKNEINLCLRSYSQNHVDFDVGVPGDTLYWRFTAFYGFPATCDRYKSWKLLETLVGNESTPWVCIGDFNEILQANEQEGSNVRHDRQMEGFCNAVEHCRFLDLGLSRNKFSWFTTKMGGIKVRLDRALGNQEWMDLFPHFKVQHLNKSSFNHVPVLLNWSARTPIRGKKQFRYEEVWHMQEGL